MADVETGVGPFVSLYLASSLHWGPAQIGVVLASQSFASVAAQAPAGLLVDWFRFKKWLLVAAALVISIGCLFIVKGPSVPIQVANQIAIGMATAFVSPTVSAISLGLVGKERFARRVGRNGAFSHAGNVSTAALAGFLGYKVGQQWIFYICAALGALSIAAALSLSNAEIDNDLARQVAKDSHGFITPPVAFRTLLRRPLVLTFAAVVVLFHIANAAMLPLAGQEIAHQKGKAASVYMTACILVAQAVMIPVAAGCGRLANRIGRKPILLFAFAILTVRGVLFMMTSNPEYIVAIQALDGIGTGISGVLTILVISDLAKESGRFNFLQGAIQACVGIGAFVGNLSFGRIATALGYPTAFAGLACVAIAGFTVYACFLPETRANQS